MSDTLFSKDEMKELYNDKDLGLVLSTTKTGTQTKAQKDFLSSLRKHQEILENAKNIDEILNEANIIYTTEVLPEFNKQNDLEKQKFEVMLNIYITDKLNLKGRIKESFRQMLLEICSDNIEDGSHASFYYNSIIKLETKDEKEEREANAKDFQGHFKNHFGIDIDFDELSNVDLNDETEKERLKEKYKSFFENQQDEFENQTDDDFDFTRDFEFKANAKNRKKTSKQLEKEKRDKEVEDLLNKDINKLFRELAKVIHPDRELDPVLREKKENLMKQLSVARDNTNIGEILYIKMLIDDLVPENNIDTAFNDDSVKRFVKIIKQKIKEIETVNLRKIFDHPLFYDLNINYVKQTILKKDKKSLNLIITKKVDAIKEESTKLMDQIESFKNKPKLVKELVKEYQEQEDSYDDFEDFEDFFSSMMFK